MQKAYSYKSMLDIIYGDRYGYFIQVLRNYTLLGFSRKAISYKLAVKQPYLNKFRILF